MNLALGQDFHFGFYERPVAERMRAIRQAGFNCVMFWWNTENYESDGSPESQYDAALKAGLAVHMVHFPTVFTYNLWSDTPHDRAFEHVLSNTLLACGERGIDNLVFHASMRGTPPLTPRAVDRLNRALETAEKMNVNLALENVRDLIYNRYLFEHIASPRLTFCYDSGHANCFSPDDDLLAAFGDRLTATHLHDNHGEHDEHLRPGLGNINFPEVMRKLRACGTTQFHLESSYSDSDAELGLDMEGFLRVSYENLQRLLAMK